MFMQACRKDTLFELGLIVGKRCPPSFNDLSHVLGAERPRYSSEVMHIVCRDVFVYSRSLFWFHASSKNLRTIALLSSVDIVLP